MCRLFIANQRDYYLYDKSHGILKLMKHLENTCGGHGNGYALVKNGKIIAYDKGQALTNEAIYHKIKGVKDWDYALYHTRIASVGTRSDSNCHPFVHENSAIAMNGTVYDFYDIAEVLEKTDTELIFKLVRDLKPLKTTHALASIGAIFVGFSKGKPYAVKGSGDLVKYTKGTGSFHASSFPTNVPSHLYTTLHKGYIWINGNVIQEKTKVKVSVSKYSGYSGYSDYDKYFDNSYRSKDREEFEEGYEEGYQQGFEDGQACWETGVTAEQSMQYHKEWA